MQTFGKDEKLCSQKAITDLFSTGKQIFKHPVKLLWLAVESGSKGRTKVIITVSKRNFKRAVDRNKIKRLLRECYRKNKPLTNAIFTDQEILIGLIYIGKNIPQYNLLEPIIIELLHRLNLEYEKTSD